MSPANSKPAKAVQNRTVDHAAGSGDDKTAEVALRRSEELFRSIFESSTVGVAVLTPDTRFDRVNPAFCALTGYSGQELLAVRSAEITYPDDLPLMLSHLEQLLAGATTSFVLEKRYLRKDGSTIWVRKQRVARA